MIGLVSMHRLKEDLLTYRTLVVVVVTALLLAASMGLMVRDLERRQGVYSDNLSQQADMAELFRPPELLSTVALGAEAEIYGGKSVAGVNLERVPSAAYENLLLALFPTPDVRFIVQYVLSLFAIMMAFDVVAGLKERKTLALIFAHPVPRCSFLLGQCLGSFISLTLALMVGFLLAVLLLMLSGVGTVSGETALRLLGIAAVSLLYLAVFFMLGAAISALSTTSARAFIVALLTWVVLVLVLPPTLMLLSSQWAPIPSRESVAADKNAVRNDILSAEGAFATEWPRANAATEALDDTYARQVEEQQRWMKAATRLSPSGSYVFAVTALAATSEEDAVRYIHSVRGFLSRLRSWVYVESRENPEAEPPSFFHSRLALAGALAQAAVDLILLTAWLVGFAALAFWRFRTYDVR